MSKMPKNYEEVMMKAKEKSNGKDKLNKLKPIANKIIKAWDKLSDTEKKVISVTMKDLSELIEHLKEIV